MGGLGPGIGGFELLVIGLVALIVVGPKDLPLLMRKVGRVMARARAMASEFRASFDEMARQSELDELRKEVEALRRGQGLVPLGPEAEATFRDIQDDLQRPLPAPAAPIAAPPRHSGGLQGLSDGADDSHPLRLALPRLWSNHRTEAELASLGNPPVGVGDVAQLAGQADLAETRQRPALRLERLAGVGRCHRQGHR